ncbi:MAG: Gfo/Idh/MocA family oxidoreductase [Clostridia bacterium]|nr:Gfo/Idh/MocA family oxidoreductase [Clostridia bacterium]
MSKKTYAFAGASQRAYNMFMRPMLERFDDCTEIVGIFDTNLGRAKTIAGMVNNPPVFENFDEMVKVTKPDIVLVTTVDAYHSDYIIRAMELGCDVVTEKPMTIDPERINAILEAEKRTGKKVTVTFNYRYAPYKTKIKELIRDGVIGDVFSVHFEWLLDRNMDVLAHGTSYFRRWNSRMKNSGGLLVHKATHHFDLVNWWIGQNPKRVAAFGKLNLYGTPGSKKYANGIHGENCRRCSHAKECGFYFEMPELEKKIYAENEHIDGYFKDGCVYASDIDIFDTMAVNVEYDGGAMLTYSLNATCPYEGWRIVFNGSKGRMEATYAETGPDEQGLCYDVIRVFDLDNNVTDYKIERVRGNHGGGDLLLHEMLFRDNVPDPLGLAAGTEDGAKSCIIGACANISIWDKRMVEIDDYLKL